MARCAARTDGIDAFECRTESLTVCCLASGIALGLEEHQADGDDRIQRRYGKAVARVRAQLEQAHLVLQVLDGAVELLGAEQKHRVVRVPIGQERGRQLGGQRVAVTGERRLLQGLLIVVESRIDGGCRVAQEATERRVVLHRAIQAALLDVLHELCDVLEAVGRMKERKVPQIEEQPLHRNLGFVGSNRSRYRGDAALDHLWHHGGVAFEVSTNGRLDRQPCQVSRSLGQYTGALESLVCTLE